MKNPHCNFLNISFFKSKFEHEKIAIFVNFAKCLMITGQHTRLQIELLQLFHPTCLETLEGPKHVAGNKDLSTNNPTNAAKEHHKQTVVPMKSIKIQQQEAMDLQIQSGKL